MIFSRFVGVFLLLALAGCGGNVEPEPISPTNSFERGRILIAADTDAAVVGRLNTVTTRCVPLLDGKGRVQFISNPSTIYGGVEVLEPFHDTMPDASETPWATEIPVTYSANAPLELTWRFRFTGIGSYTATAVAYMDSVYIADSTRYFSIRAEEVRLMSPKKTGYVNYAGVHDNAGSLTFRVR